MTKKILLATAALALGATAFAQNGNVGIGTTTPASSAKLDITATDKGMLPPRMTQAQMNAIVSPAQWLMAVCTDCNPPCLYMYNGTAWKPIGDCGTGTSNATFTPSSLSCSGTINGTYLMGTPMTNANTKQINVNVTIPGIWTAGTNTANGITFSGSGTFTTIGVQTVTLTASGTLSSATTENYVVTMGGQTCSFTAPDYSVTTFAGSGSTGKMDGVGTAAQFNNPNGLAIDGSGNVYVADQSNHTIRKITPAGVVSTLAGSGGISGYVDATGAAAKFNYTYSTALDVSGNVYVADQLNNRIRKVSPAGVVTTLVGSTQGYADGTGTAAQFYWPRSVAVDGNGNIYVADYGNHRIRKVTPAGVVSTLAGSGTAGNVDGTGTAAQFNSPTGVAVDGNRNVYVADQQNHRIRKIDSSGVVTTLAGSTQGYIDGIGAAAKFSTPWNVAVDGSGNIYVTDYSNSRVRKITPTGVVSTLAGNGSFGYGDGTLTDAQFNNPIGIAVNSSGTIIYVADYGNNRIRKITP